MEGKLNRSAVKKIGGMAFAAMFAASALFSINLKEARASVSAARENEIRQELKALVDTVNKNYYKETDTVQMLNEVIESADEKDSIDKLSKRFVEKLKDPYSEYYTAEELKSFNSSMKGEYYGIGVEIAKDSKTGGIRINEVFKGSPAEKAKLKKGDIIIKVGKTDITKMELAKATTYVKGKKGTAITLTIVRNNETKKIRVVRDEVIMPSVSSKTYEKGKIGYIRVSGFLDNTDEEFIRELNKFEKKGISGLIIDLRNNGGGYVDTAYNMLNRILPSGETVLSFEYANGKKEYLSNNSGKI